MLPRQVADFLYERIPLAPVLDARIEYGFPLKDLKVMWDSSEPSDELNFLGMQATKTTVFYSKCAARKYDECETYLCVNGCCSVWWHPKRGNQGGFGPAGCSCDNLKDPRGEKVEDE